MKRRTNYILLSIIGMCISTISILVGGINNNLLFAVLGLIGGFSITSFSIERIRVIEFEEELEVKK